MTNIETAQNPTSKSITAERHAYRFHVPNLHLQSVFGDDWFALKAEAFARFFGTPSFLIAQTVIVAVWILINVLGLTTFDILPIYSPKSRLQPPGGICGPTHPTGADTAG